MNKSKLYQHKIVEISFDASKLNNFPNERGISYIMAENESNDKISSLRDELMEEIYELVHGEYLTDHQKKILMMRLTGKTQNEIAEHLGITQSAVHKAMHGNIDYKNNRKRYGGIIKKLRKICKTNPSIQKILSEIGNAKNEREV